MNKKFNIKEWRDTYLKGDNPLKEPTNEPLDEGIAEWAELIALGFSIIAPLGAVSVLSWLLFVSLVVEPKIGLESDFLTTRQMIKLYWSKIKGDGKLKTMANSLKSDPEVQAALKNKRTPWKQLFSKKLSGSDKQYVKSLGKKHLKEIMKTKKFNIKEWRDTYLKGDTTLNEALPYDAFDKKPSNKAKKIDPEDLTYPLESAMARVNVYDLEDIKSLKQFNDLVKAMKKTGEVPSEFFALKAEDQMGLVSQAIMYI